MNLLNDIWKEVEGSDDFNNPTKSKIRKYLNKDVLQGIYADEENKRYYIESIYQVPKYVKAYIKKFCKEKGYTYLYD